MNEKTPGDGTGASITLQELSDKLYKISHNDHRWTAVANYRNSHGGPRKVCAVQVWYTNPDMPDIPNSICYSFPSFPDDIWGCDAAAA